MTGFARVAACAVGFVLLSAAVTAAHAADGKAIVDQIKTHNQAATSAYGKWDEMKKEAEAAIALGTDNDLGKHADLAQAYVLLGVAEVELKHKDAGISAFVKALQISAAAEVPNNMNKKAVKLAFSKAEDQDATAAKSPPPEPKKSDKTEKTESKDKEKQAAAEPEKPSKEVAAKETKESKGKEAKEAKEAKEKEAEAKTEAKTEAKKAAAEKQAAAERDKQAKDEAKAGAAKEKLEKEKQAQLQKEKADKEQELTAARGGEKKEREAREKAEKAKADADKQIAELKARVQQLEKDTADKDHQLSILRDDDKKEREAKEKLEKVWQEADAREKERKAREAKESTEREKLAEGPDFPRSISEPIHCTIPDEAPAGADLYIHCAAQPGVGAKLISFYYRPAGVVPYNAILMEPSKKGWFVAMIPGKRVNGKFLHYYVEARDAKEKVAATSWRVSRAST